MSDENENLDEENLDEEKIDTDKDTDIEDTDKKDAGSEEIDKDTDIEDTDKEEDEENLDEDDDKKDKAGVVTLSTKEYNQLRMFERLAKKDTDQDKEPNEDQRDEKLLADLKKQFPLYKEDQLSDLFKMTKMIANASYQPIADRTIDSQIEVQISTFANDEKITKEDKAKLLQAVKNPTVKKALHANMISVSDMYCLLDYKRMKKRNTELEVKYGNKDRQKKGHANAGGKKGAPTNKQAGGKKFKTAEEIEAMSWDEYEEYRKSII